MREARQLLTFARAAIGEALGGPPAVPPAGAWFEAPAATFVTLHLDGALHGCIGSLVADRPLADSVRQHALAAAFRDPRGIPLEPEHLGRLTIEISRLSPLERIEVEDEAQLCDALRPGVDGVLLSFHGRRGTFLPQVWEHLPRPADFVRHLKSKAGLPHDFWSPDMVVHRYTVERFADDEPAGRQPGDARA